MVKNPLSLFIETLGSYAYSFIEQHPCRTFRLSNSVLSREMAERSVSRGVAKMRGERGVIACPGGSICNGSETVALAFLFSRALARSFDPHAEVHVFPPALSGPVECEVNKGSGWQGLCGQVGEIYSQASIPCLRIVRLMPTVYAPMNQGWRQQLEA